MFRRFKRKREIKGWREVSNEDWRKHIKTARKIGYTVNRVNGIERLGFVSAEDYEKSMAEEWLPVSDVEGLQTKLSRSYDEFSRLSTASSKETKARTARDLRLAKQLKDALIKFKRIREVEAIDMGLSEPIDLLEAVVLELENK